MALWLVRHATPCGVQGVCYGALDVPAEATHTLRAAQALAAVLPPALPVFSSPRQRCVQLAQALQALRPDLAFTLDERLAEMDFGEWEGVPWCQIPKDAIDLWTQAFASHLFGGRESVNTVMQRVAGAWDALQAQHAHSGLGAVWITHAGVARATDLLARGQRTVRDAADWPVEAPAFGGFVRWPLA